MYIIVAVNSENTLFMGFDRDSGGYPFFSTSFSQAHLFIEKDHAKDFLEKEVNREPRKCSDGTVWPNSFIHNASGVCNVKPKDTVILSVKKIEIEDVGKHYKINVELPK